MKEKQYTEAGWDARDRFLGEIVLRLNRFLSGSPSEPRDWFENLRDFFSIVYPFLQHKKEMRARILGIKAKLYAKTINGLPVTDRQRKQHLEEAYEEIRQLFEEMHEQVYKAGIYLPLYEKPDIGKAVLISR